MSSDSTVYNDSRDVAKEVVVISSDSDGTPRKRARSETQDEPHAGVSNAPANPPPTPPSEPLPTLVRERSAYSTVGVGRREVVGRSLFSAAQPEQPTQVQQQHDATPRDEPKRQVPDPAARNGLFPGTPTTTADFYLYHAWAGLPVHPSERQYSSRRLAGVPNPRNEGEMASYRRWYAQVAGDYDHAWGRQVRGIVNILEYVNLFLRQYPEHVPFDPRPRNADQVWSQDEQVSLLGRLYNGQDPRKIALDLGHSQLAVVLRMAQLAYEGCQKDAREHPAIMRALGQKSLAQLYTLYNIHVLNLKK
ncbi:hypothetical protein MIR68_003522 [Amoeboaphelidium protococcarum]|nr:hypothetical protein MIR68_003522 [Amoeboaphelidium protococcarum]